MTDQEQSDSDLRAMMNPTLRNQFGNNYAGLFKAQQDIDDWTAKNKADENKELQERKPPEIDPRFANLQKSMTDLAKDYRNNIPGIAQGIMTQLADQSRRNLADTIDKTRQNFNSRGLLYSTARMGAEAGAQGRAAADLQSKRYDVNQQLDANADQLDNNALNVGLGVAGIGQDFAKAGTQVQGDLANAILKSQQNSIDAAKGLGSGIGGAVGLGAGLLSGANWGTKTNTASMPSYTGGGDYGGAGLDTSRPMFNQPSYRQMGMSRGFLE